MSKKEIEDYAQELQIPFLLHFTNVKNLEGIMKNGLRSREWADNSSYKIHINDQDRADSRENTISVSIGHPNDRMFYKCWKTGEDWCVLAIEPEILWTLDCLFLKTNAATTEMSSSPTSELGTIESLKGMYAEKVGTNSREHQKLEPSDPTDKEAEVLIIDYIPVKYIGAVVFNSDDINEKYKDILSDVETCIHSKDRGFYASRSYYRNQY